MLQYFLNHKYHPSFSRNSQPRLEYICNVDNNASAMPRSMHEHKSLAEILLVYQGAGIYMIDGKRYTAQKGDIILYNACTVHDEYGGSGMNLATYCIGISNLQLVNMPLNHILPAKVSPILSTNDRFDEIYHLFRAIEQESKENQEETASYLMMALITSIKAILQTNGNELKNEQSQLAIKIREFIDNNYTEDIHLTDIAAATNTNAYYFSHQFKAEIGLSPMKYVILRRLGEAQNLLINTDMTITQISAQVGYNNSNYFQNVFRNALGITPGDYRRKWTS